MPRSRRRSDDGSRTGDGPKPAPRRTSVEDRAAQVFLLRGKEGAEESALLRGALSDPSAFVVAAAAKVIAEDERGGFATALAEAFPRFLADGVRRDPGCRAKTAIVRALLATGEHHRDTYLAGVRCVQAEPVWGGTDDTAVELRAQSLAGLVRSRHPGAAVAVATLLADAEPGARAGAAESAAELEPAAAEPLLRFKVLIGDAAPEVIATCWTSLLQIAPGESLPAAVAALGARGDDESDAVALALGASRLASALDPLIEWSERGPASSRQATFTALTLLRHDRALDHLVRVVALGPVRAAAEALRALAHFRHDRRLVSRVRETIGERSEPSLGTLAEELLGPG